MAFRFFFLAVESQYVQVNGVFLNKCYTCTGTPQGCVLSPSPLFSLHKCQRSSLNKDIIKFADDSVILSLLESEGVTHKPVIDNFTPCSKQKNVIFGSFNVHAAKEQPCAFLY